MADSQKLRASNGQKSLSMEITWKIVTDGPAGKAGRQASYEFQLFLLPRGLFCESKLAQF